ncbi:MAG: sensor histidine kinase, partial [Muribaculaceae bacterium]|nr:sensor histidine kinase [Muribaculaceae bacterium]
MKRRELLIHLLCWSIVLFLPVFLRPNDPWDIRMNHFVRSVGGMLSYIVVFYVNYLWFIPKMLLAHRRRAFILSNVILVVCAVGFNFAWWTFSTDWLNIEPRIRRPNMGFPTWLIFQWVLMLLLVISLSVAVRMSQRWRHLEQVRKEVENARVEAELSNLRNQLNP